MTDFIKKYWFLILLASAASILGLTKILFPVDLEIPTVAGISPKPNTTLEKQIDKIEIELDKDISSKEELFSLSTIPEMPTTKAILEKTLTFNITQLLVANQKYLFELKYKNTTIYSWSYQTGILETPPAEPSGSIENELGDPDAVEKIAKSVIERYPLVKYVPFENEYFSLNYSAPLVLSVKIKSGDKTDIKWQVYEWLKDKGVDPDSHQIEWIE